jgi:protein-S-isoprenylcysteine O-methyltransferase Ste14
LARLRVPMGFVAAPLALVLAKPGWRSIVWGGVVMVLGEAMRIWAAGHLEKGREVTRSGPYRWCAHPLYVGSSVVAFGFVVASASWWVAALVGAYLAVGITAAVRSEEAELRAAFGEVYVSYRERRTEPMMRPFSLARAWRNREYRAVVGIGLGWAALALRVVFGL